MVMEALKTDYGKTLDAVRAELGTPNIETILSRVRSLAGVIGKSKVHDLDGEGYKKLSEAICEQIGILCKFGARAAKVTCLTLGGVTVGCKLIQCAD